MANQTNNDLCTPEWLIDALRSTLGDLAIDPCSNEWTTVRAALEIRNDELGGGLAAPWHDLVAYRRCGDRSLVFVNPPYGPRLIAPFVDKAIAEANEYRGVLPSDSTRLYDFDIVMLIPSDHSVSWWHRARSHCDAIAYLNKRVRFLGGKHGGGFFPSAMFYWGKRPYKFATALDSHADVRVLRHRLGGV